MSCGSSSVAGCWLVSLPARESGKPELISGADCLVCCKASQVCDKNGMDAKNPVVKRACVGTASPDVCLLARVVSQDSFLAQTAWLAVEQARWMTKPGWMLRLFNEAGGCCSKPACSQEW